MRGLLMLPLVLGCTSGDDKGDDTGGSAAFSLVQGVWTVTSEEITVDTCGFSDDDEGDTGTDDPITFTLSDLGDGAWSMLTDDDEADPVSCTLVNRAMTCDSTTQTVDMSPKGLDAVIGLTQSLTMDFTSGVAGNYAMNIDAGCEGDDCGTVAGYLEMVFPCTANMSGAVEHTGG